MRSIHLITPASCIIKIQGFIARMKRLEEDNYTLPRLRTQDLNALIWDVRNITIWASIGTFNKNKERADNIIKEADSLMRKARKLVNEYETILHNKS